jgi:hypothetical protein
MSVSGNEEPEVELCKALGENWRESEVFRGLDKEGMKTMEPEYALMILKIEQEREERLRKMHENDE